MKSSGACFLRILALSIPLTLLAAQACAAGDSIDLQLRPRLDAIQDAWSHQSATGVADVYSSDALATGEGVADVAAGRAGIAKLVKELMNGTKDVHIDIYRAKQLSTNAAMSWVTWTVTPSDQTKPVFKTRSLFIWQKVDGRWHISSDMWAMGGLPEK
ncbi:nuclear transport factor 2 family protein [Burkholderia sp. Ac-20353]|uniref:YybH family protein n=1 Tax=Burkholderia sp. Ac-20353 TaxID=2703894 RepID=UPI00197BE4AA|nr:nuclear transport factor 2 family protein [Burkholderia sp. Ac-20353]MBN3787682.1 nuclear transport factor 2 family protein [Burkholderia sp. Ac-20353]